MKINCSLDTKSIDKAIRQIERYQKQMPQKLDKLLKNLAELGADTARQVFGSAATVTVDKTENGYTITANGEAVCFLEFGTGVYASVQSEEAYESIPFKVKPGSWSESEEGAHTWSAWLAAGGTPETYPYNHTPRPGMFNAYQKIRDSIAAEAQKVFSK